MDRHAPPLGAARDEVRRRITIFGLDVFAHKHRVQLEAMAPYGFAYDVYVHDGSGASEHAFEGLDRMGHRLNVLPDSPIGVASAAKEALRTRPHHVEYYTTDPRSMAMPLLARLSNVPLVTVERGLVSVISERARWKRWALTAAYRLSSLVIFKEPHMESLIRTRAHKKRLEFVPNSVRPVVTSTTFAGRDVDFLWANRILADRYCEWLTDFSATSPPGHRRTVVAGIRKDSPLTNRERAKQDLICSTSSDSIEILDWVDPRPLMMRSRFFVLSARHVFGNNALLEAMSMGCVPIVTRAPGVESLIEHGVNGLVSTPTKEALQETLQAALKLPEHRWTSMSLAASQTVKTRYSPQTMARRLSQVYCSLRRQ